MRIRAFTHAAAGLAIAAAGLAIVAGPQTAAARAPAACPASAASEASAAATAKACGGRVEALAERTETSQVFANPDGTSTLEISAEPKRVHRSDGSWAAIDTTLHRNPDGSLSPAASLADVRFSGGGDTALVTVAAGERSATLGWPTALPVPTLAGDTATYANVLPDVDLAVRATATGFTHVLVVKTAAAAGNPALRDIAYPVSGRQATTTANAQGGISLIGDDGVELIHSGGAAMWDSAATIQRSSPRGGGDRARTAPASTSLRGGGLHIAPDPALLASATYPLYIDPAFTAPHASRWAYSDNANANNDTDYARVGLDPDDGRLYRSFFEFPVSAVSNARIISANFEITLWHSWSCGATSAYAWRSAAIASTPRTAWSPALQVYLGSDSAGANKASCYDPATPTMSFSGNLRSDLQSAANAHWSTYTIGLTTRESDGTGESTQSRWKKFYANTATLKINYNHAPRTPTQAQMTIDPSFTCGPTPVTVNTLNGVTLRAILGDQNNDNVKAQWSVTGIAASYAPPDSGLAASNTEFSTTIPGAAFTDGGSYSWTVRATDNSDTGAYGPACPFTVDNSLPGSPTVSTTDLALGSGLSVPPPPATAVVGASATVTLTPAAGDTNIAGYLIGVGNGAAATPSIWVPSQGNGAATAAVIPLSAVNRNMLTVQARNVTGQTGGVVTWAFKANAGATTPHVRFDATGDGKPDITALMDAGDGNSALWRWSGRGSGVAVPVAPQDVTTAYPTASTLSAVGDFDGDGLSDVALVHRQSVGVTISVERSNGNGLLGTQLWASDSGWAFDRMKLAAGDYNGDGLDDLAVLYNMLSSNWRLYVFLGNGGVGTPSFAAPVAWAAVTNGTSDWNKLKFAAVDLNGDGKDDIVEFYNATANSRTQYYLYTSTGSSFATGSLLWDSGAGMYPWERASWTAGDVNHDGRDDLVSVYNYDNCVTGVWVAMSTGTGIGTHARLWMSAGGDFCATNATPVVADFTGDGLADLAFVYRCCGPQQGKIYVLRYNGAKYDAPVLNWEGAAGGIGTGGVALDNTGAVRYKLVNINSGKCVTVPGSPPTATDRTQLVQYTCNASNAGQQFTITRVGQSSWIHMTHVADKCIDDAGSANYSLIQLYGCNTSNGPGTAQYFTVEYRSGYAQPVVRLVNRAWSTCLDVNQSSLADNAVIQNYQCNQTVAQDFFLTPVG